ncbi:MAG: rod shape-determining protein MreC [Phycisphaerae bacterium]
MRFHLWRPSKPATFALLMLLGLLFSFLPVRWLRGLRGVLQPMAILQAPVSGAVNQFRNAVAPEPEPDITPESTRTILGENAELRRRVEQQRLALEDLRREVARLAGLRDVFPFGRASIVPAAVLAFDASARRTTLTMAVGTDGIAGLREGLWVAAGEAPDEAAAQTGREAAAGQYLIGRISEAHPFVSRVQLATDPGFGPVRAAVARIVDGAWQPGPADVLLTGAGGRTMRIERATSDHFAAGATIVMIPASLDLPMSLTIGQVVGSRPLPEAPLFFDLDVRPWGDYQRLRYVYVIIPASK